VELSLQIPEIRFGGELVGETYRLRIRVAPGRPGSGWRSVEPSSEALSDPEQRFTVATTEPMATGGWEATVEVPLHGWLLLYAELLDASGSPVLGQSFIYRWPAQEYFGHSTVSASGVDYTITLYADYGTTTRAPQVIYARRGNTGWSGHTTRVNVTATTVFGIIHPVIAMPSDAMTRVVYPGWVAEPTMTQRSSHDDHRPTEAWNPAVLPAWEGEGRPDQAWLNRWESKICVNALCHRGRVGLGALSGAPFDREITWRYEVVEAGSSPPEVEFLPPARGREVKAFARGEGEVRVIASYRNEPISELRALVRQPVTFAARTIVLLPTEVQDHGVHAQQRAEMEGLSDEELARFVSEANDYLRQVAIALPEMTIEQRTVAVSRTVGIADAQLDHYGRPYGRTRTVTFLVIHSIEPNDFLGVTVGFGGSDPPHTDRHRTPGERIISARFTDRGTPSTSLLPPSGLAPGPPAEPQTMRFIAEGDIDRPIVYLVRAANPAQGPISVNGFAGRTIAHEMGHVLGLRHRREGGRDDGCDGLPDHGQTNLMAEGGGYGDLDIAQAKIMWASPLLHRQ